MDMQIQYRRQPVKAWPPHGAHIPRGAWQAICPLASSAEQSD